MEIIPYNSSFYHQWDTFVQNHDYSCPGQHVGVFSLERELGRKNYSYVILDEKKNLIGIMPLFLFNKKIKRIFKIKTLISGSTLRSGPLFSTGLSQGDQEKILDTVISQLIKRAEADKVDNIWISYPVIHGERTSLEYYGYYPLKKYGFKAGTVVTMIKDLRYSEDELIMSLHSKCRNMIRSCKKKGGQFVELKEYRDWMNCYDLNIATFEASEGKAFSKEYMEIVWNDFIKKGLAAITAIKFDDKIISISVNVFKNKSAYLWMIFNSKPSPIPGANNLLIWETMLYLRKKGVDFYEIGSKEFENKKQIQISQFKQSFNGRNIYCLDGELELRPIKNASLRLLSLIKDYNLSSKKVNCTVSS